MAKGKDVAWGFFYTPALSTKREILALSDRRSAVYWRKTCLKYGDPTPIFRITPPKPKRRKK